MTDFWEDEEVATETATEADIEGWQRDLIRLSGYDEWYSLRKLLLYREKQLHNKLYTQNTSRQEMFVGKLIGKAGAYRDIINLPQELKEKAHGRSQSTD